MLKLTLFGNHFWPGLPLYCPLSRAPVVPSSKSMSTDEREMQENGSGKSHARLPSVVMLNIYLLTKHLKAILEHCIRGNVINFYN